MSLALCTQICNRNAFLGQALPTWLDYPANEIIIFDFAEEEKAIDVARPYHDSRIVVYECLEDIPYNVPQGRNAACRASSSDWLMYIDSDIIIQPGFPFPPETREDIYRQGYEFSKGSLGDGCISGTCIMARKAFDSMNGFNERLVGWGWHDNDYRTRIEELGYHREALPKELSHIDHDDALRVKMYPIKDRKKSAERNQGMSCLSPWTSKNTQRHFKCLRYQDNSVDEVTL